MQRLLNIAIIAVSDLLINRFLHQIYVRRSSSMLMFLVKYATMYKVKARIQSDISTSNSILFLTHRV